MREYILTVAGAAVLSAFAVSMSPSGWEKYLKLITGVVVLCCIISPLGNILKTDIDIKIPDTEVEYDENLNREIILNEFSDKISGDIEERLKKEFGLEVKADTEIELNEDNEIEGVKKIITEGDRLSDMARSRLNEVYGVDEIYEK